MKRFKASIITCQNKNGVVMVGFANDEFKTTEYLLLQRTLEPDQQDQGLSHDKIHIELDSQKQSGYGGIKLIRVDSSTLYLKLNEKMAKGLGTCAIEVKLNTTDAELATLKEHLSILVGDEPILQV